MLSDFQLDLDLDLGLRPMAHRHGSVGVGVVGGVSDLSLMRFAHRPTTTLCWLVLCACCVSHFCINLTGHFYEAPRIASFSRILKLCFMAIYTPSLRIIQMANQSGSDWPIWAKKHFIINIGSKHFQTVNQRYF